MSGGQNGVRKQGSLFGRIRNSIRDRKKENEQPELLKPLVLESETGIRKPDGPRIHKVDIPEDSLLYSLWREWSASADRADGTGEYMQAENEIFDAEPLGIEFGAVDFEKAYVDEDDIDAEKGRMALTLMMKAKTRFAVTRPNEEGTAPDIDAEVVVHVSKNRMGAWVFIFPPCGKGAPLSRMQLELELAEHSVCAGIDEERLESIVEEQPCFQLLLVASGTPAVEGKPGYIIENFERELKKTFGSDDRGNINYHIQNNVQEIHAGDVICEAAPPVSGKDGVDVLGNVIHARETAPAKLLAGKNTKISEDGTKLFASMDGHLGYKGEKFYVEPTYYVRGDLDLHTGNINFIGDVQIAGNVRENFVIQATGNVFVGGLVEGAVIEAGGDIAISDGILGEEKAVIKAGGTVRAEFIESSIVYAGGDVIAGSIISSMIYSDNKIEVRFGRGTIIGGKLVAGHLIQADIIGCRAERLTTLVVGELPYVQKRKEEIASELERIGKEAADIERTVNYLEKQNADDTELVQKAADYRLRKSVLGMQAAHLRKQREELMKKQELILDGRILANTVYPVAQVQMLEFSCTIREKLEGYSDIHIEDGEIVTV